jgi:hypothetical protein
MRMSGNPDDAEDLTQNVIIKSWEWLNTRDTKYKFFSCLYCDCSTALCGFVPFGNRNND